MYPLVAAANALLNGGMELSLLKVCAWFNNFQTIA